MLADQSARAGPANVLERSRLARCYLTAVESHLALGQTADALACVQQALVLAEALSAADPDNVQSRRLLGRCCAVHGHVLAEATRAADAISSGRRGVEILEELARADPDNALVRRDLARACHQLGGTYRQAALSDGQDSPSRADAWREARLSFICGVAVFERLEEQGILSPPDRPLLEQVRADLRDCEAALTGIE